MGNKAHARQRRKRIKKTQNVWNNNFPVAFRRTGQKGKEELHKFLVKEETKIKRFTERGHTQRLNMQRRIGGK